MNNELTIIHPTPLKVLPPAALPVPVETFFTTRASDLSEAWHETTQAFRTSIRRVVTFGLLLSDTKERGKQTSHIPHGQFIPWLEKFCPEIPERTARQWMQLAEGVLEHFQIGNDCRFGSPLHQILQLPAATLSPEAAELQAQIFDFVDGKSQKQLLMEWRGEPKPKQYNPPQLTDEERIAAQEKAANDFLLTLAADCDAAATSATILAEASDETRAFALDALVTLAAKIRGLKPAKPAHKK